MKVPPLNLSGPMDRLPLPLPFSPDLLWRYPLGFPQQPPPSPLLDFKTQMPGSLASDPRLWSREDVVTFLHWCERDFDLPPFDIDRFQMNGKALCLLTKQDLDVRAPGSGDVVHNALQLLLRDAPLRLPSSPLTPSPRSLHPHATHPPHPHPHTPLTPTSQNASWPPLLTSSDLHSLSHLIHQSNSVTLSPAPSVDSQAGSPQHQEGAGNGGGNEVVSGRMCTSNGVNSHAHPHHHLSAVFSGSSSSSSTHSGQSGSQSDSEDSLQDPCSPRRSPVTPSVASTPLAPPPLSPVAKEVPQGPPAKEQPVTTGTEAAESNTNGRLLWDFLQQLLNDPAQRYCNYIAWKNRDIGVFKIVDPPGLARLWGIQKNHLSMNYDKMSRALRYYYRVNILRKVQGERHCYQFLRNPGELKNIKNISLLRQQMSSSSSSSTSPNGSSMGNSASKAENETFDEMPTDLSMDSSERSSERNNPFIPHITIKTEDVSV